MKNLLLLGLLFLAGAAQAEMYRVTVTKVADNLYKTSSGLLIVTKYCYEYAISDSAILIYDRYSYDNKLVFERGDSCEVEKVAKF
jgi:hypothetical protein